jgi:hypothetical protein
MRTVKAPLGNPFRPGAGHMPPYLAGRQMETEEFNRMLKQDVILQNMILTGLRGVGKTVLLDTLKPIAIRAGWLWVGTDLSESTTISEERLAVRMIADLSVVTSSLVLRTQDVVGIGFRPSRATQTHTLDYDTLHEIFDRTPGLIADKLKAVLETVWVHLAKAKSKPRGVVFAYDESQNLSDHASKDQYPLSLMLDVFQSIQKRNVSFMLVLAGLPTLLPKLVDARTFAERMFHVLFLDRLDRRDSRDAIIRPIAGARCPIHLDSKSIDVITDVSGGYPYFIQFICREVYDSFIQKLERREKPSVPIQEITRKLDCDFFAGRWARATDRQRELLGIISNLENCDREFTVQEVAEKSKSISDKPFSPSHINQMLVALGNAGLVYKNRHGKYSFAVPLLGQFILRQAKESEKPHQRRLFE